MLPEECMGAFIFPDIGLSVPFTDGVTIVWHSALIAHGTARSPNPPSKGMVIGTSIQITKRLVDNVKVAGYSDWLKHK